MKRGIHPSFLVVEDSRDVSAMENIQEYHGRYHVLHGLISPMNGVGPDDINLKSLISRLMDVNSHRGHCCDQCDGRRGSDIYVYLTRAQTSWDQSDPFGTGSSSWSRYRVCGRSDPCFARSKIGQNYKRSSFERAVIVVYYQVRNQGNN